MSEWQVDLQHQTNIIRKLTLREIGKLGVGHVGGNLPICEVLVASYFRPMKIDPHNPGQPERDRLVLSRGHDGPTLYAALALKGYFSIELLNTLNRPGTMLPGHCDIWRTVDIDMTTGSLGQGFSAVVGMALVIQMDRSPNMVYTIIGGGKSDEGQIWEITMSTSGRQLDHLITFTDYNKVQIDGYTQEINLLGPLEDKWRVFGWYVQSIDGHNTGKTVSAVRQTKCVQGKPSMILLNTIKGKGASFSEGKLASHNVKLTEETRKATVAELEKEGT